MTTAQANPRRVHGLPTHLETAERIRQKHGLSLSRSHIWQIERRAMEKIRAELLKWMEGRKNPTPPRAGGEEER